MHHVAPAVRQLLPYIEAFLAGFSAGVLLALALSGATL